MPTKGKLPTAREMEGQVLAALQELGGPQRYTEIDKRVKENLEPFVYFSEFKSETKGFYETTFATKCAAARRSLRKQGKVDRSKKLGEWQLYSGSSLQQPVTIKRGKRGANRVTDFAAEAEKRLKESGASSESLQVIRQLWGEFQMAEPEPHPTNAANRQVEAAAIAFIRKIEPNWQPADTADNPNNPGFDLYQTDRNGKKNLWCEVKGLSKEFNRVSLTAREFNEARKRGKRYWLYVVENAESDNSALIKINDPANKAKRFSYGSNSWRRVAE